MKHIKYAYLATTNYCNLDCSFCNRKEVIKSLKHMSLETFAEVLKKLEGHPIEEAKLMGMGEPYLHPQFDEICKMFKEAFPNAYLIVATNCQHRVNKRFKESLKYIDQLYFSIDGYKESFERDRGGATWTKLIKFLDDFSAVDRYDCEVVCNYVVNPDNVYDIPLVNSEIVKVYGLKDLRLNIAQNWSEDESMVGGYTEEQLDYLRRNYKENIKGEAPWTWSDCFWVKEAVYMTVEGDITVCCLNTSAEPVGNILEQTIEEIHSSFAYDEIRQGCANNEPNIHCANCSYKELSPLLESLFWG